MANNIDLIFMFKLVFLFKVLLHIDYIHTHTHERQAIKVVLYVAGNGTKFSTRFGPWLQEQYASDHSLRIR